MPLNESHDHFKLYKLDSLKIIKIKSFVDLYFQHVLSKGITCILDVRKTPKLFKTFFYLRRAMEWTMNIPIQKEYFSMKNLQLFLYMLEKTIRR